MDADNPAYCAISQVCIVCNKLFTIKDYIVSIVERNKRRKSYHKHCHDYVRFMAGETIEYKDGEII